MWNHHHITLHNAYARHGWELRMVGGAVRDMLSGKVPHDVDFATTATPEESIAALREDGYTVLPTGLHHGTITVMIDNTGYEVTTLRKDISSDGRWSTTEWTSDWDQDMARRDFTINAMSMTCDGTIHDPFGGQEDLRNGVVRFVGDAHKRIQEDYLRIIRFYRFMARYGSEYPAGHEEAIRENLNGFSIVKDNGHYLISRERISSEMRKIISGQNVARTFQAMARIGLLEAVQWRCEEEALTAAENGYISLAGLVGASTAMYDLDALTTRWAFTRDELKAMRWLIKNRDYPYGVDDLRFLLSEGLDQTIIDDYQIINNTRHDITMPPPFPVSGDDLDIPPGPALGKAIREMKTRWKNSSFTLTKHQLIGG